MDLTGVRSEYPAETEPYPAKDIEGQTITVFEVLLWQANICSIIYYYISTIIFN